MRRAVGLAIIAAAVSSKSLAAPPVVNLPPGVDPTKIRVTTFATDLNYPTGMLQQTDGGILVASSFNPSANSFYSTINGALLRFTDADQNGVADGAPINLTPSDAALRGAITSIRQAGNLLFVNHAAEPDVYQISVLRAGATPTDRYTTVGKINFAYTGAWQHQTYALATRRAPGGGSNQFEVLFNVGSQANAVDTPTNMTVGVSGLVAGTLLPDSVHKFTFTDNGGANVSFSGVTQIATGLRNAAGMDFHPTTGDLWMEDNGIDGSSGTADPRSADELNRIPAANIGGAVEDFGFASDYIAYRTGVRVGSGAIQPEVAFTPLPNPANGAESEGPNEIAFSPANFPAGLNNGVFVGFHGKFNNVGAANEENAVVYYDIGTDQYYHFISPGQAGIGHLDGLMSTSNSLFLSDITAASLFAAPFNRGSVYQVAFVPEPGVGLAIVVSVALLARRRGRRSSKSI